jgi:hypothetical protein
MVYIYSQCCTQKHTQTWNYGIRDSMKGRNLKGEVECFDGELWRKMKYVFGPRKSIYSQKHPFNNIDNKRIVS